jgi:hypothetical protein
MFLILSCLSLQFFENSFLCSYDDLIAYRFMLVLIMLISYQVCLVCKSFSKSCPHDQFMLNYGLTTKLYLARLSGSYSKPENPYLTEQVRSSILPDKSDRLGIKPFDHFPSPHSNSFSPFSSHRWPRVNPRRLGAPPSLAWWFLGDSIPFPPRIRSPPDLVRFKVYFKCSSRDLRFLPNHEVHCIFLRSIDS